MKRVHIVLCTTAVAAFVAAATARGRAPTPGAASAGDAVHAAAGGSHAGGHAVVLPDEVRWKDSPSLPPGAKVAILEGDPTKEGYFAMRVRMPDGYRIPPHWHPCKERVTVLSGSLYMGTGDTIDKSKARALPAGSYASMEAGVRHFAWTSGETTIQVTTIGPWGITYVDPADDPRRKK